PPPRTACSPRGRRVHRRVHRGTGRAAQLPVLPPGDARRADPDDRAAARRRARRRGAAARHPRPGAPGPHRRAHRQHHPTRGAGRAGVDRTAPRGGRGRGGGGVMSARPDPKPSAANPTAPGVPAIVSSRFGVEGAHTLDGYRSSGSYPGYESLRAALEMSPAEVGATVKDATVLGRGGAGFPAGVKWGFCPEGVWPRYLVINGDESEPGTYKDRLLMERDPHQLI